MDEPGLVLCLPGGSFSVFLCHVVKYIVDLERENLMSPINVQPVVIYGNNEQKRKDIVSAAGICVRDSVTGIMTPQTM